MSVWLAPKDFDHTDTKFNSLVEEAYAAAPKDYAYINSDGDIVEKNSIKMMPRTPTNGACRLCGSVEPLTREHIPPRASGNKDRTVHHSLTEWLSEGASPSSKQKIDQGGIYGYTLCQNCNNLTGKLYGRQYKRWYDIGTNTIASFPLNEMNNLAEKHFGWEMSFGTDTNKVRPGAFVRQVLSCMCSLSGEWNLSERYPEIRRIVLTGSVEEMPKNLELGMALFVGPHGRLSGPQLLINPETGVWRWCQEIAFPPFAFFMVLASNKDQAGIGLMMNDWTLLSATQEAVLKGVFEVGFGWTPLPGDYRSQAAIRAGVSVPI